MPRDIEDLLRESLAARAQDVSPDPELFQRVQHRIRRGRIWRLSAAGGVAVAALSLAVVVGPNLRSQRVEFAPAPPVASQPAQTSEEVAAPTVATDAGALLFSAGDTLFSMALDGESPEPVAQVKSPSCAVEGECTVVGSLITEVASRAGSTHEVLTGLIRTSEKCGRVGHISRTSAGAHSQQGVTYFSAGGCASAVGVAPDGRTGAVITDGGAEASGLSTFDWDDAVPGAGLTTFEIGLQAGRTRIEDWVWTTSDAAGDHGFLYLAADGVGDYYDDSRVYRLPIERQADGAVALPASPPEKLSGDSGYHPWAYAEDDGAYTIDVHFSDDGKPDGARLARRVDDVATAAFDLPDELFVPSDDRDPWIAPDFWLDTLGNTIAYGDGDGAAWIVTWDGTSFTAPRRMAATVVTAELLARPQPAAQETPAEAQMADVEIYFAGPDSRCLSEVAVTRAVPTPGVARGALTELLAGPTPAEQNEGLSSPFSQATAGALLDVTITDGVAQVDLMHLGEWIDAEPCVGDLVFSALERTLLQFSTVDRVRITFDGSAQLFRDWKESGAPAEPDHGFGFSPAVAQTSEQIRAAAAAGDYNALRALIDPEQFSCAFGDEQADCVKVWQNQEEEGLDPLGVLVEVLAQDPAPIGDSDIWTYPAAHATDPDYLGPRTGIDVNGVWRYYQQGGD